MSQSDGVHIRYTTTNFKVTQMDMNIELARFNMIEQQVRPWDVLDQRVLDLMSQIPREAFVPEQLRALAFADTMLPLGNGEVMMEPKLEGRILQALALQPDDKVLEVGTGSGYLTALLAAQARKVVSVELDGELLESARQRLAERHVDNVNLHQGNAADGWGSEQPYDAIVLGGSVLAIPQGLKENMQVGGRLFAVVGEGILMKAVLLTRDTIKEWRELVLFETSLPPLHGLSTEPAFRF